MDTRHCTIITVFSCPSGPGTENADASPVLTSACCSATNAARTSLYDIHKGRWSTTICELFDIPLNMLPEVKDSAADFGVTRPDLFGQPIPIRGVAGDQQAATFGQGCFEVGMAKNTYGTGCFLLLNTGTQAVRSTKGLLTTVAYQVATGKPRYALEGSVAIAGSGVQWLRDQMRMISDAPEIEPLPAEPEYADVGHIIDPLAVRQCLRAGEGHLVHALDELRPAGSHELQLVAVDAPLRPGHPGADEDHRVGRHLVRDRRQDALPLRDQDLTG